MPTQGVRRRRVTEGDVLSDHPEVLGCVAGGAEGKSKSQLSEILTQRTLLGSSQRSLGIVQQRLQTCDQRLRLDLRRLRQPAHIGRRRFLYAALVTLPRHGAAETLEQSFRPVFRLRPPAQEQRHGDNGQAESAADEDGHADTRGRDFAEQIREQIRLSVGVVTDHPEIPAVLQRIDEFQHAAQHTPLTETRAGEERQHRAVFTGQSGIQAVFHPRRGYRCGGVVARPAFAGQPHLDPRMGLILPHHHASGDVIDLTALIATDDPGGDPRLAHHHHKAVGVVLAETPATLEQELIDKVYEQTGLYFNIISHDLENFYLQQALVGFYDGGKKSLLVNIGGGSIELVVVQNDAVLETHNIAVGIGPVLQEFPGLNQPVSGHKLTDITTWIRKQLPDLTHTPDHAFYTGGELHYMQLAGYNLQQNSLFKDSQHPSMISRSDFASRNEEVFSSVKLTELEALMPEDPKWMHGARACSAIAQAIFDQYKIETIVPSNANLVDGVVRQEFRTVTLSGSFRKHLDQILALKQRLNRLSIEVLSPRFTEPQNPGEEFVIFEGEEGHTPLELERHHMDAIDNSDALIVCSVDGYVGASAMLEIGYAHKHGIRTIYTEEPNEFMLQTLPHETGV